MLALYEALLAEGVAVQFTVTDKYPNLRAFQRLAQIYGYTSTLLNLIRVDSQVRAFG